MGSRIEAVFVSLHNVNRSTVDSIWTKRFCRVAAITMSDSIESSDTTTFNRAEIDFVFYSTTSKTCSLVVIGVFFHHDEGVVVWYFNEETLLIVFYS